MEVFKGGARCMEQKHNLFVYDTTIYIHNVSVSYQKNEVVFYQPKVHEYLKSSARNNSVALVLSAFTPRPESKQ